MKKLLPIIPLLMACAPATIEDYNAPYEGKWAAPETRPASTVLECKHKPGKFYTLGHEHLCKEGGQTVEQPEPPKPPVECTMWQGGVRYALGNTKQCARVA